MSYLRYLCLFVSIVVSKTLCCVFVMLFFVLCTLCCQFLCVFVLFFFVLCTLCCQFLCVFVLFFFVLCTCVASFSVLCFVFLRLVYPMLPVSLCCVLFFFVLCTLCCQFLWIVHFWLPFRYSLTFIKEIWLYTLINSYNKNDLRFYGLNIVYRISQRVLY
jgi:hypothetical protein